MSGDDEYGPRVSSFGQTVKNFFSGAIRGGLKWGMWTAIIGGGLLLASYFVPGLNLVTGGLTALGILNVGGIGGLALKGLGIAAGVGALWNGVSDALNGPEDAAKESDRLAQQEDRAALRRMQLDMQRMQLRHHQAMLGGGHGSGVHAPSTPGLGRGGGGRGLFG